MKKSRLFLHPVILQKGSRPIALWFLMIAGVMGLFLWIQLDAVIDLVGINLYYGLPTKNSLLEFLLSPYVRLALILCSALIAAGITSMRIVGPVKRIEQWLIDVEQGHDMSSLRVRKGDKFSRFVELINKLFNKQPSQDQFF